MQGYLEAAKVCTAKYMICLDAYDILANPDAKRILHELVANLQTQDISLMFGWETRCAEQCWDISEWRKHRGYKASRHVNAGCLIGRPEKITELWTWVLGQTPEIDDDQIGFGKWLNAHPKDVSVAMDDDRQLVANVSGFDCVSSTLFTLSAFVHCPGPVIKLGIHRSYNAHLQAWLGKSRHPIDSITVRTFLWQFTHSNVFRIFLVVLFTYVVFLPYISGRR